LRRTARREKTKVKVKSKIKAKKAKVKENLEFFALMEFIVS
jgi:hypothetical protein